MSAVIIYDLVVIISPYKYKERKVFSPTSESVRSSCDLNLELLITSISQRVAR